MNKNEFLIILAILILGITINVEASELKLNERKIQYYKNLSYNTWKSGHKKQIEKIQIKIRNMTEERFRKMKDMQLDYWKNNK